MRSFDRALVDGRSIRVRTTDRSDGDFAVTVATVDIDQRRRRIVDRPWVWLDQVHGARCIGVDEIGPRNAIGAQADAAFTAAEECALSVQTADCVPVALWTDAGVIAAVHAGWRGLAAGVVESAVSALRSVGQAEVHAFMGPSIGPECYEFGVEEIGSLVDRFGPSVRSVTTTGRPALDVRAGVRAELARLGVDLVAADETCTACDDRLFSHRARADAGRQAMVVWIESS